jgi:hypothetical protein
MANNVKKIARGAVLTTPDSVVYTVPGSGQAVVTNIVLTNTTGAAITSTVKLATVEVLAGISIAANGVFAFDLRQVLDANETITASASATGLKLHISGMEVTA